MVKKKESCEKEKCSNPNIVGRRIMGTIVVLLFAFHIYFVFFLKDLSNRALISNIILTSFALLAFASCVRIYLKMPKNFPAERKGYIFLMVSVFLFFLGDLIWLIEEIFVGNSLPIGGLPDISWNLAYFALIASIYFFSKIMFRESNKIYYLFLFFAVVAAIILEYFGIRSLISSGNLDFAHLIQGLYVVYDLILIVMILNLILPIIQLRNKIFISWTVLFVGLITRIVFDYIFVVMAHRNLYYSSHPVDLIYVLFYIAIVFSNIYKCKTLDGFEVKK